MYIDDYYNRPWPRRRTCPYCDVCPTCGRPYDAPYPTYTGPTCSGEAPVWTDKNGECEDDKIRALEALMEKANG